MTSGATLLGSPAPASRLGRAPRACNARLLLVREPLTQTFGSLRVFARLTSRCHVVTFLITTEKPFIHHGRNCSPGPGAFHAQGLLPPHLGCCSRYQPLAVARECGVNDNDACALRNDSKAPVWCGLWLGRIMSQAYKPITPAHPRQLLTVTTVEH